MVSLFNRALLRHSAYPYVKMCIKKIYSVHFIEYSIPHLFCKVHGYPIVKFDRRLGSMCRVIFLFQLMLLFQYIFLLVFQGLPSFLVGLVQCLLENLQYLLLLPQL